MSLLSFLANLPKRGLFSNEGLHLWGAGLWTYFWLAQGNPWYVVIPSAIALSALHEWWYDRLLPNAPPAGAPDSPYPGILENWLGYIAGIALGALLHFEPLVGKIGFWGVCAAIFGEGAYLAFKQLRPTKI